MGKLIFVSLSAIAFVFILAMTTTTLLLQVGVHPVIPFFINIFMGYKVLPSIVKWLLT